MKSMYRPMQTGNQEQCPTVVNHHRCMLDINHFGKVCISYNVHDEDVSLGVMPVEESNNGE